MTWLASAAVVVGCGDAIAAVETAPSVHSATAQRKGDVIVVSATIDLPNGCWSNPRLQAPKRGVQPDADGVVRVLALADSTEGPGIACSMIFRPAVPATPLHWRRYPAGVKAIKVEGARASVVAPVQPAS